MEVLSGGSMRNILQGGSQGSESDVVLEDIEILDSENDDDSDPFINIQRAKTEEPVSSERVFRDTKRSRTDPSSKVSKVLKKRDKIKDRVDLLKILLPDNVNVDEVTCVSRSSMAESFMDSGLEVTNNTTIAMEGHDEVKVSVNGVFEGEDGNDTEEDTQKDVLEVHVRKEEDRNEEREYTQEETGIELITEEAFHAKEDIPDKISIENAPTKLDDDKLELSELEPTEEHEDKQEKPLMDQVEAIKPSYEQLHHDSITKTKSTSSTKTRPSKRTSSLLQLCQKSSKIPYRAGLSKRANVNHLHPNLKRS